MSAVWECGTPRSTGNAFCIRPSTPLTKEQIRAKKKYAAKVAREQKDRTGLLLDSKGNAVVPLGPRIKNAISIGSQADADKTKRIIGKANHARSE